jgi:hypothetical protein
LLVLSWLFNRLLSGEVQVIGDALIPALCALMQVPHVHVTRMCSRLERCSGDGGVLRVMQVLTFNGALHQETSCDEVVDTGLVTHDFDPVQTLPGVF